MLFSSVPSMYSNVTTSTRINILQCTYVHLRLFHSKLHSPLRVSSIRIYILITGFVDPIMQQLVQLQTHNEHSNFVGQKWKWSLFWDNVSFGNIIRFHFSAFVRLCPIPSCSHFPPSSTKVHRHVREHHGRIQTGLCRLIHRYSTPSLSFKISN